MFCTDKRSRRILQMKLELYFGYALFSYNNFISKNKDREEVEDKTAKHIQMLGITSLSHKRNVITVKLNRPGILIGSKGFTYDFILEHLRETFNKKLKKIEIVEDNLIRNLYGFALSY